MSDVSIGNANTGPALDATVEEVQGYFPDNATLQNALTRLNGAGFDRAQLSLPEEQQSGATPTEGAENPTDFVDKAQLRTLGTGMAAYAGATAAAGVTLATGGLAGVAIAAAAAVGLGTGLAANAGGQAAEAVATAENDQKGAEGRLILAVRTSTPDDVARATALLQQAGATKVQPVRRGGDALTAGVSSASWTG